MEIDARYEFLDKVGAGSYATVYRARDRELGREVAIKQIHQQYLDDPGQLERYWSEAQLLASLHHPNVVTIFDIYRERGWLILELMQANLRDRLEGRQMDLRSLRTTIAHCLRALKYLHSRGIIHGDIKPSNLMIDHRKRIKLGDFGLARRASDEEGSLLKGTTKYMAPELVSDEYGDVGPQSDLYSLGFTAYELMCGASFEDLFPGLSAFGRDKQAAWIMWHAAPDRKLPEIRRVLEGVPDDLAQVIQRLTEKDPNKRYATADEALSDLNIDVKLVKTDAQETEDVALPQETGSDQKRIWIAAGAFGFSLLLSVLLLFWPAGPSQHSGAARSTVGIVRFVDLDRGMIEIEDPVSGIPDEVRIPPRPDITLLNENQKILPRRIEPGDWIEIDRRAGPGGEEVLTFKVARPVVSSGVITEIDPSATQLTIAVSQGRVRDNLVLKLRESTGLTLNGRPARLRELAINDAVQAEHVLDPSGRGGHWLNTLHARRRMETTGFIEELDLDRQEVAISFGRGGGAPVTYSLAAGVDVLQAGQPFPLDQIRPGDRVRMQVDEQVHLIEITRTTEVATGTVVSADEPPGILVVSGDDGNRLTFRLSRDADLTLAGRSVGLRDLRAQIDSVTVRYDLQSDGARVAQTVDAHRGVRHDRWALVIGTSAYSDRSLSPVRHAAEDAREFAAILIERYAVDANWVLQVLDGTLQSVRGALRTAEDGAARKQLIVFICGRAYLDAEGRGVLAFSDFRHADMMGTGLLLEELVTQLEASTAREVLLLLDLSFPGTGADRGEIVSVEELLESLRVPLMKVSIIGSCSRGEVSHLDREGRRSLFVDRLIAGIGGPADVDQDLILTADEIYQYLRATMQGTRLPPGVTQTPYLLSP